MNHRPSIDSGCVTSCEHSLRCLNSAIADLRGWRVSGDIDVDGLPALRKLARDTNLLVFNSVVPGGAKRVEVSASRVGRRAAKSTAGFECGCRR